MQVGQSEMSKSVRRSGDQLVECVKVCVIIRTSLYDIVRKIGNMENLLLSLIEELVKLAQAR